MASTRCVTTQLTEANKQVLVETTSTLFLWRLALHSLHLPARHLLYYITSVRGGMASTVPTPSNADILAWTEDSLRDSHVVRRLKPLFEALGLRHLDRDDPSPGAGSGASASSRSAA